jgi:hypothetical protein
MSIAITPFLRNALNADAAVSGAAALLMVVGAPFLSPWLGLPTLLIAGAGLVLVPFVGFLIWLARRNSAAKLALADVVIINAAWVVASFGLLLSGWFQPTALGIAFVVAQALAVAVFAELQFIGLRRASATA